MESGKISSSQISASSQWDNRHAPNLGRLNHKETHFTAGSWSALRNDANQWFQVDLRTKDTKVTRFATQGRNYYRYWPHGPHSQWLTKYKLQYSNDGVTFHYFRELGQTTDKVKTLFLVAKSLVDKL